uniref:Uncharacterized protein n=1 Tax=Rhizophora mucronata TaxID=61149 RepID=A0A2P2QCX1_RHIMU
MLFLLAKELNFIQFSSSHNSFPPESLLGRIA